MLSGFAEDWKATVDQFNRAVACLVSGLSQRAWLRSPSWGDLHAQAFVRHAALAASEMP